MTHRFLMAIATAFCATTAMAADYRIVPEKSALAFRGTHANEPFEGKFTQWTGTINFDPAALASSTIEISIDMASATTGNKMYDGTLPGEDWLGVKQFPKGKFVSTSIERETDGSYIAKGNLTIRDVTQPVKLAFALTPAATLATHMSAKGSVTINRLDYHIGEKADATAEWVGKDISITFSVEATQI